jgi:hypothetical protein
MSMEKICVAFLSYREVVVVDVDFDRRAICYVTRERANEVTQKNILHIRVMTGLTIDEEQKCTKLF